MDLSGFKLQAPPELNRNSDFAAFFKPMQTAAEPALTHLVKTMARAATISYYLRAIRFKAVVQFAPLHLVCNFAALNRFRISKCPGGIY